MLSAEVAEGLLARGNGRGAIRAYAELIRREPSRESLRQRYMELGGSPEDLPAFVDEAAVLPEPEALEAVFREVGMAGAKAVRPPSKAV